MVMSSWPSGRGTVVVTQQAAKTFTLDDVTAGVGSRFGCNDLVAKTLMGPLSVIVGEVLAKHAV